MTFFGAVSWGARGRIMVQWSKSESEGEQGLPQSKLFSLMIQNWGRSGRDRKGAFSRGAWI